jgi:hypothetical protein
MSNDISFDDDDEIFVEQWQRQITDEDTDYERRRGSVHRGAAYLQDVTYPPHGTSGGQEGGAMRPEEEIEVLGEDYSHGLDVLGAAKVSVIKPKTTNLTTTVKTQSGAKVAVPVRAGFVQKQTPGGRTHTSLVVNKPKQGDDKSSIKNAKDAGNRAISAATKMKDHLKKVTVIRGDEAFFGAATSTAKKVAPKGVPKTVVVKMGQMLDKLADKGKKTVAAASKHEQLVKTAQSKLSAGTKSVAQKMDPSKSTKIKGDDYEDFDIIASETDLALEILGAALPDPTNPGYLLDGSPDPAYGGVAPGYTGSLDSSDPYATSGADQTATALPGPPDYGLGPAPKGAPPLVANQDYIPDPGFDSDFNVYSSTGEPGTVPLPEGAVIYDGSQAIPTKGAGSYTYFHKTIPGGAKPDGNAGSGFYWNKDHWNCWWASAYHDNVAIDTRKQSVTPEEAASLPFMAQASEKHHWGPLIGNPQGGWTAGMRYDQGGNQWFWYYDKAPSWATAADKMKRDNQALLDYQAMFTAAQTDYTTQQMQDQIDAQNARDLAKQQAAEDAQMARQMQQEQAQAAHQAELQAVQDQQTASQQQMADEQAYRQAQIDWEGQARQSDQATQTMQAQALMQAQIDQQAMESQARIEQQAAETQARIAAMQAQATGQMPSADDGGGEYASDEGGEYADDGGDHSMDSFEDAKYSLDNEDVLGHVRGLDKHRLKRAARNRGD